MIWILIKPCERQQEQSALAREMLFSTLSEKLSLPKTEIKKTEDGKPYFDKVGYPAFSISHTDGAVCVAISDGAGSVGVDIEKDSPRLTETRLTDRFFPSLTLSQNEISDIEIEAAGEISDKAPAEALFTLGEAIIKCDGRGFAAAGEAARLSLKMRKASFKIKLSGTTYYLSVALFEEG